MNDLPRLSRSRDGRAAAPVRLVHLGLGNFFRAHQAAYTEHAPDAAQWGYAAFTGHRADLADAMNDQDGLYTLLTRGPDGDRPAVIGSVGAARPGTDVAAWRERLADPAVAVVTVTVTEAAYQRTRDGGLDTEDAAVRADLDVLRRDPAATVSTMPARMAAGLGARRRADAGPLTLVPCDNLPGNGAVLARVVSEAAELLDPALRDWIEETVSVATTVVDRITPRTTEDDLRTAAEATGRADTCPVVTEPFSEWVISGRFPGGRPAWDAAGATFTDDVGPFEQRKLWLLNGAHSLLAYTGPPRGRHTVAEAVEDPTCRSWVEQWWDEAARHLPHGTDAVRDYRAALADRFTNHRIRHRLAQVGADGSQKLPVRIVPVLRAERSAGRLPAGAVHALGGWIVHLRGAGADVPDAGAGRLRARLQRPLPRATEEVLRFLDPALADDPDLVDAVAAAADEVLGKGP